MRLVLRVIAWLSSFSGAALFLVATYMKDSPRLAIVWKCCAVIGFVLFPIESALAWYNEKDAKVLQRQLDAATKDNSELKAEAKILKAEVVTITAKFHASQAPRLLSDIQQKALVERMGAWRGQIVMFFVFGNQEAVSLLKPIRSNLLGGAGWVKSTDWSPGGTTVFEDVLATTQSGVIIQCCQNAAASLFNASADLSKTLNEFGIAAASGIVPNESPLNGHPETLYIAVGNKV